MRLTHDRSHRYGGHTKHSWVCICGRTVTGNGGKQHFRLEGHRKLTRAEEEERHAQRVSECRTAEPVGVQAVVTA